MKIHYDNGRRRKLLNAKAILIIWADQTAKILLESGEEIEVPINAIRMIFDDEVTEE